MKKLFNPLLMVSLFLTFQSGFGQTELFRKKIYCQDADTLPYRILYPDGFDKEKAYSLIVVLHGSGERGNDNALQLVHGGDFFASPDTRKYYPAIVVFPQCSKNSFWAAADFPEDYSKPRNIVFYPFGEPTSSMKLLLGFVDQLIEEQFVDKSRVYVGGISMGGMGTYELLYRRPDIFAAAFPICGGGNPEAVHNYAQKVKIWAFHGAKDNVVMPIYTIQMIDAIHKLGGEANLTLYPEGNHGVWDNAFAEPELLKWLFSVRKTTN